MKKFLLSLLLYLLACSTTATPLHLLGQRDHSGTKIEIWSYTGALISTTATTAEGFIFVPFQEGKYKLKATHEGYFPLQIDSVALGQGLERYPIDGILKGKVNWQGHDLILLPLHYIPIRDSLNTDLTDTSQIHLVENVCTINKIIRVAAGVKLAFKHHASFYVNESVSFEGTPAKPIRIYETSSKDPAKLILKMHASATLAHVVADHFLTKSPYATVNFEACNIQQLHINEPHEIVLRHNTLGEVIINDSISRVYDSHSVFSENTIANLYVKSIHSLHVTENVISKAFLNWVELDIALHENVLKDFSLRGATHINFACNHIYGPLTLKCDPREPGEASTLTVYGNIFHKTHELKEISFYNYSGETRINNNFFAANTKLDFRPSGYRYIATKDQVFENNILIGDMVINNDSENRNRPLTLRNNIIKGRIISAELRLSMTNNLLQEPVMCLCLVPSVVINTENKLVDRNNNLYDRNIAIVNDTVPILMHYEGYFSYPLGVSISNTCLEDTYGDFVDHEEKPSISGQVFAGDTLVTKGYVAAVQAGTGRTRIVRMNPDGSYLFSDMSPGSYYLQAIPQENDTCGYYNDEYLCNAPSHDQYIPSIYLFKQEFNNANPLVLTGKIREANLYLLQGATEMQPSSNKIWGTLTYKDTSLSDYGTGWMTDLKFLEQQAEDRSNYCVHTVVLIKNLSGVPLAWTLTDVNGNFMFDNLPDGPYTMSAVRYGYELELERPGSIEVSTAPIKGYLVKSAPNILAVEEEEVQGDLLMVSPNPFEDICTIQGAPPEVAVRIYDMAGKLISVYPYDPSGSYQMYGLQAGIYYARIGHKIVQLIKK